MSKIIDKATEVAVRSAWSNPQEDRRLTFKPVVFSKLSGVKGTLELLWDKFVMPDSEHRYVVLMLGQLSPKAYGLHSLTDQWTCVADLVRDNDVFIQLHTNSRVFYHGSVFIKIAPDKSVLFAVRLSDNQELIDLKTDIYLRFYSNAWLNTPEGTSNAGVDSASVKVDVMGKATAFLNKFTNAKNLPGNTLLYHNGFYKNTVTVKDIVIGDTLEFVTDRTGVGHFDTPLADLKTFDSVRDSVRKYIVLQPDEFGNKMLPSGDIEIYICSDIEDSDGNAVTRGVYYSNLFSSDIRSLTHRDWSVNVLRISNILNSQKEAFANPYLRVFLRNAMWTDTVIDDGQYIKDLYLLDNTDRGLVMSTAASPIEEWKAENLENSPYTKWMELSNVDLSLANLRNVYSYDGLSTMLTRSFKRNGLWVLPPIMEKGGIVFCYNLSGLLYSVMKVTSGLDLELNASVMSIDCYPGNQVARGTDLEATSAQAGDKVDTYAQELFFRGNENQWKVAEEGTDFSYDLVKGEVNWNQTHSTYIKGKRLAGRYYMRDLVLRDSDVGSRISIFENNSAPGSGLEMGRLQLWIGNRKAIRGFDYVIEYPYFRFIGRELYTTETVNVKLFYSGLTSDKVSPKFGFIRHGKLNYGGTFDLSFNRNIDINIAGHRASKDQVVFSELPDKGTMNGRFRNGMPYSVEYPLDHINSIDLRLLSLSKAEALSRDSAIEDYLNTVDPEDVDTDTMYYPDKYALTSPLMHTLIEDILSGSLVIRYDDPSSGYVASTVSKYLYILNSDPISNTMIDWRFVDLHPTGRTEGFVVDTKTYSFLSKVNELYLNGRCNLNTYISVQS